MKLLLQIILIVTSLAWFVGTTAYAQEEQFFTCPMHPHYISTDPEGNCPICGMDLVPTAGGGKDTAATPKGSGIAVAAEMIQTMGVRIAPAKVVAFGQTVRAYGNVEPNTRREAVSVSRMEGWIEDLAVSAEGDAVRSGQLLYRVYSPDLVAAQKDFIAALKIGNRTRINASEQRLRSLGMQRAAIATLRSDKKMLDKIPVFAETAGVVQSLDVREGAYVKPGASVLRLQSYADVWVIAAIAEQDIMHIKSGMPVEIDFPSAPMVPYKGVVDYVYPTIDPATRTLQVRIVVENADGYLRPGAFADVAFVIDAGEKLSVPSEAILRSQGGMHVVLSLGEGRFASRQIMAGIEANGRIQIISGLEVGENVVISGQFLLDSETNLREGLAKLSPPMAGPDTPLSQLPLDAENLALLDHFVDAALYFHEALTDRYAIDPYFLDPAIKAGKALQSRFPDTKLIPILIEAEAALMVAKTAKEGELLKEQLAELMNAMQPWLLEGAPRRYRDLGLTLNREPEMDRLWIQQRGPQKNPYTNAPAETLAWPEPMQRDAAVPLERPVSNNPHAGH